MEDPRPNPGTTLTDAGISRRSVVLGVSAVGAAGLLSACGGGDDTTATGSDDAGDSGASSESPSASASDGGGGALTKTSDVPVGGGMILQDKKIVVTQPTDGTFKAFSAVCTHQSCLVGTVKDGLITCPCHGSQYNAADGAVKRGPASRGLTEVPVTVEGDQVVQA